MGSTFPPARERTVTSTSSFLSLLVSMALLCASTACERAGEVSGANNTPHAAPRGAEVAGFVVGQVAAAPGPRTAQPVNVATDAEMGRRVRKQLLELTDLHEETTYHARAYATNANGRTLRRSRYVPGLGRHFRKHQL